MDIQNKTRILAAIKEHSIFQANLEELYQMRNKAFEGNLGVYIGEYSDGSGLGTDKMYLDGNYNAKMETEILNAIIGVVEKYHIELIREIDKL